MLVQLSESQLEIAYRIAGYLVLYHTCSDKLLEHQLMLSSLYNAADSKWRKGAFRPYILPLVGNQLPAVHFAKLVSWLDRKEPSEYPISPVARRTVQANSLQGFCKSSASAGQHCR